MKKLFLFVALLCGFGDCLALNEKDTKAIVAGATVAIGVWSWWGHLSNKKAISRAECLWDECNTFIGRHASYIVRDLDETVYNLEACPILKREIDIIAAHKSLLGKMNWFWNRSHQMALALKNIKILKESLDAYKDALNRAKQQRAVNSILLLWSSYSSYDLDYDPSFGLIKSTTLQDLYNHPLLKKYSEIGALRAELLKKDSCQHYPKQYCHEYSDALKKIEMLEGACDRLLRGCRQIQKYDDIVESYQNFIAYMYKGSTSQSFVEDARRSGSGEFPLLNFVEKINEDIKKLSMITLRFAYARLSHSVVISSDSPLNRDIEQHLRMVSSMIVASSFYQDELRFYHEKLRRLEMERRLADEQRRLQANLDKVNHEIEDLKYDNWRLAQELKNNKKQ